MKTTCGYIGLFVGILIGLIIGIIEVVVIAAIIFCIIGRFIGESIDKDWKRQEHEANEAKLRKKEAEEADKLKAEKRAKVLSLIKKYPEATKYYFKLHWGITKSNIWDSDITDDRVDQLLSHEYTYERDERTHNAVYRAKIEEERAIEKKEEEVRRKAERQRILALNRGKRQRETAIKKAEEEELNNLSTTLPACVSEWYTHAINGSIKHKWFIDYYPCNRYKNAASDSMKADWKLVWGFKNDERISSYEHTVALSKVVKLTEDALKSAFSSKVKYLTLVCLSASTIKATKDRFEDFSDKVCADLGMGNGLNHIHIVSDVIPKHLGGTGHPQKQYDEWFFRNKYVILFDDVRTSGSSLELERRRLEAMGATVIGAITIAQTMS
jgi:hypothetical protein